MPNSSPESDLIDGLKVIISKQLGIALSNKKLGTLLLSANRFNNIIRDNAVLRKNSLDKIELKLRQLLNESNLKQALMVLEAYRERRSKIYSQSIGSFLLKSKILDSYTNICTDVNWYGLGHKPMILFCLRSW